MSAQNTPACASEAWIELYNVETHNLRGINPRFPLNQLTVVTGVSGSGKSSLVFDTLYGESYRRYLESLSSFARQYMVQALRPKVGEVRGLPAAIAVKQNRQGANQRSTVATLTELNQLLEVIFTEMSRIYCIPCQQWVPAGTLHGLISDLKADLEARPGVYQDELLVLAPLRSWSSTGMSSQELKLQLQAQGFSRLWTGVEVVRFSHTEELDWALHSVVVDRLRVQPGEGRTVEALSSALKLGRGCMAIVPQDSPSVAVFVGTLGLKCPLCFRPYREAQSALFSCNHPLGACKPCQGFGKISVIDWHKVMPDEDLSLAAQGLPPLNFGEHSHFYKEILDHGKKLNITTGLPFKRYSLAQKEWLKFGGEGEFKGMAGYFAWLNSKVYKPHYRMHAARFHTYVTCADCQGHRFGEASLAYRVAGASISEVYGFSLDALRHWLEGLVPHTPKAKEAVGESVQRCDYLARVGVSYLSMGRTSTTLSGGELQRIQMARCLGSQMTDTLYCLDEPSTGLHPQDTAKLLSVLQELRDGGNTVVVVEHDRRLIEGADYVMEIGPGAGHRGGELVYAGPVPASLSSLSLPSLSLAMMDGLAGGGLVVGGLAGRGLAKARYLELKGACCHNLKHIDVSWPLGHVTVVCGVSGSGKSSLVRHTLYPALVQALDAEGAKDTEDAEDPGVPAEKDTRGFLSLGPKAALDALDGVLLVAQAPLGRSRRSNIATYLGAYDLIRKLFSKAAKAMKCPLEPGAFSFNTPGGRCEVCKGLGYVEEELSFLGTMPSVCPSCQGKRFSLEVLQVFYKGYNLIQVLEMTLGQAREVFKEEPALARIFEQVHQMGLDYMVLGQHTTGFSGGEAQRLKLLKLFVETEPSQGGLDNLKRVLIFDEPSSGLADRDVAILWAQMRRLCDRGHTVIIVEHHIEMIRHADYVVEIGPRPSNEGGYVVYQGPPAGLKECLESPTRPYL